jgi:tetratricopeptide (TPR) repeat protein
MYYLIQREPEKAITVLKMWAEIFPDDIQPHEILAVRYQYLGDLQSAIREYKQILNLDSRRKHNLRYIGDLYLGIGQMDSARFYYEHYMSLCPEDYKGYRNLAEFYIETGDYKKASEFINKALILNSKDIDLSITRLDIDKQLGHYQHLDQEYIKLFEKCTNIKDSNEVLSALSDYYEFMGMTTKSLEFHQLYMQNAKEYVHPLNYEVMKVFNIQKFVIAGKYQKALKVLESCKETLDHPVNKVVAFGYLIYYVYADSVEFAEPFMQEALDMATEFGEEGILTTLYFAKGHLHEERNNFEMAIEEFERFKEKSTDKSNALLHIARCQRKMGNNRKARKTIEKALIHYPYCPKVNFEAYLIYSELNRDNEAMDHLEVSNGIWKNADKDYIPAQLARSVI